MELLFHKSTLSLLILTFCYLLSTADADINYVRPSKPENSACPSQPCLTFNDYANDSVSYFLDNSVFVFMEGLHRLDTSLDMVELHTISFIPTDEVQNVGSIQVLLSPLVNITWTKCANIEIRSLQFVLTGEYSYDNFFSALVFQQTTGVRLLELTMLGNNILQSTAILLNESRQITTVSNLTVSEARSLHGAAMYVVDSSIDFLGRNTFHNNTAIDSGGAMVLINTTSNFIGNTLFVNNSAKNNGGAIAIAGGIHNFSGNISFIENSAHQGGAINSDNSNLSREILFSENSAKYDGEIILNIKNTCISRNRSFTRNNEYITEGGGAIYNDNSDLLLTGSIQFMSNKATNPNSHTYGGAIFVYNGNVDIVKESHILFEDNEACFGGAIYSVDSLLRIAGTQYFIKNVALHGGALALSGNSKLMLTNPLDTSFIENHAKSTGGVIYYSDEPSISQCHLKQSSYQECFIQLSDYYASDLLLTFVNNTAAKAGKILYGGSINMCKLYVEGGEINRCGIRNGAKYDYTPCQRYLNIITIVNGRDDDISFVSSNPIEVCFCDEEGQLDCSDQNIDMIRGERRTFEVVIVGQFEGIVPSAVRVALNKGVQIDPTQIIQNTTNKCTQVNYSLLSKSNNTTLTLFPDDSICRDSGISHREVKVTFLPCPLGFVLNGSKCNCDKRLQKFTTNCSVDYGIWRSSNDFWIGTDNSSGTKTLIVYSGSCPFDYCVHLPVLLNTALDNLDIQCDNNHYGTLCGSCRKNYSLTLGNLHCVENCNDKYLVLILPFAVAGIALIAVLLLLNISVATGTINGLLFYANIIQVYRSVFFPRCETSVLRVFIAWLNLDLGIETCFYKGMDVYAFTWLQFVFPFYIWFLIGLIVIVTHYSQKATRMLGKNPVAILATLLLFSYPKILCTIIMALSFTSLDYSDTNKIVWLYDGSISYFEDPGHIVLGVFAMIMLVFLFLPYTFLFLFGHWLQAYSNWRFLHWLNKIKPFMDAYHAPYKKGTRYWTGFLLLVRCILFLISALDAFGDDKSNLLSVTTVTAILLALASVHGGVYKNSFINILETSFIFNLCVFAAATSSYHVKDTKSSQDARVKGQYVLASLSIGIAIVTFFFIMLYHVYIAFSKTSLGKKLAGHTLIAKLNFISQRLVRDINQERVNQGCGDHAYGGQNDLNVRAPTRSFIDIREYEPLLDTK